MNVDPVAIVATIALFVACSQGSCQDAPIPLVPDPIAVESTDWPWWRGPNHDGIAYAGQRPPLEWSTEKNVIWRSEVPGLGHSSPTLVGDFIYLATADVDADTQSVLCYDRITGEPLWHTVVHQGDIISEGNERASPASATVACDGTQLFISFVNRGAVYASALSRDGDPRWESKISDYVVHQGYGASPAIYQDVVIVNADNKGGGAVAAMNRRTGEIVWRLDRPDTPNYASPITHRVAGRDQLFLVGCDLVTGLHPRTGETLWEIEGATTECVTTTVTDGNLIFTSGGYPDNHVSAVKADGSGDVVWRHNVRVYVPSLIAKDGYLYAVLDAGVAMCWESSTGEEIWSERLHGTFSSSPVMVDDRIFATNESGKTFVFRATPAGYERLAENQLGSHAMATPVFCHNRIYARVADGGDGDRQEMLYCLGIQ